LESSLVFVGSDFHIFILLLDKNRSCNDKRSLIINGGSKNYVILFHSSLKLEDRVFGLQLVGRYIEKNDVILESKGKYNLIF